MNDFTSAARKTVVEGIKTLHYKRGDALFPKWAMEHEDEPLEAWTIFLRLRVGLMPTDIKVFYFLDEKSASDFQKRYFVGREIESDLFTPDEIQKKLRFVREVIDGAFPIGVAAGDAEVPLAYDVLASCGIYDKEYGPVSKAVLNFIGKDRFYDLKERFGENWEAVAIYEYCWANFPHSSAAFVAASYKYHHYITGNDFSAGYHWRDLEVLVHDVEREAKKAIETREKAGKGGSKASAKSRELRQLAIMAAIEDVVKRNPDISALGESAIAQLAVAKATETDSKLWRQGKGQVLEYLGEIRRGEAGSDLQARYKAVFSTEPLKRFQEK
ncbi:hypothetical protein K7H20_20885 [Salipiger manganoxidans]|uniref:hypothetical protein n=1 Tax=Salipiger marinus TaxID=555512 RepID=UPI001E2DABC8|nr:hypothetical protein [Salipiger manganoxidans]MCD1620521.1 hypothetical protein [Salipiger manganoxidans]